MAVKVENDFVLGIELHHLVEFGDKIYLVKPGVAVNFRIRHIRHLCSSLALTLAVSVFNELSAVIIRDKYSGCRNLTIIRSYRKLICSMIDNTSSNAVSANRVNSAPIKVATSMTKSKGSNKRIVTIFSFLVGDAGAIVGDCDSMDF